MSDGKESSLKRFQVFSAAVFLLALPLLLLAPSEARADSYRVEFVHYDFENLFWVYGLSSDGALTVLLEDGPCGQNNRCVGTYTNAVLTGISPADNYGRPPAGRVFDNGSPCSYSVFGSPSPAVCNNGRTAFLTDRFTPQQIDPSLYVADSSGLIDVFFGVGGRFLLNSEGDIFFDDVENDKFYEAFRISETPEPSTLALLGTGLLGLGNLVRRRLGQER